MKPVKNKFGKGLSGPDQQLNSWAEHFENLLNRPPPYDLQDVSPVHTDLLIDCNPPSRKEIIAAIKLLRNNEPAGPDDISGEPLKTDPEVAANLLFPVFENIWAEERMSSDWRKGYLGKIPRKGI